MFSLTFETRIVSSNWYDLHVCVRVCTYLVSISLDSLPIRKISSPGIFVDRNRRFSSNLGADDACCYRRYHYRRIYGAYTYTRVSDIYTCSVSFYFWLVRKQENRVKGRNRARPFRYRRVARTRVHARRGEK